MKRLTIFPVMIMLAFNPVGGWAAENHNEKDHMASGHEETGHGHEDGHNDGHGDESDEGGVELSAEQLQAAGIIVSDVQLNKIPEEIHAPGEVVINAYQSTKATPRISAQIIKRHSRLGQSVKKGQVLVTLSSVEMAEAQGQLLVSDREWSRVKKLGRKVVSERRYLEAQVARQQAYAKVLAFGMTKHQVESLIKERDVSKATGEFELMSTQNGTVIKDDFIVGEIVEPGRVLYEITNENSMWVEARLTPEDAEKIKLDAHARVRLGTSWLTGRVVQAHHTLDKTTRTLAVVIEVPNINDRLHPGLFVDTRIQSALQGDVLTIPEKATIRSVDGDWVVFIEMEAGHYKPVEVEIKRAINEHVVIEGLEPGMRIVTEGVFFLQSELAKSGFEIHNH